jgi:cell wall-associated NlpC family hydrolase
MPRFPRFSRMTRLLFAAGLLAAGWALISTGTSAPRSTPIVLAAEIDTRLRAGDLVFRIGNEWQSDVVRYAGGRGDPYSHVGMLIGAPGRWQVLHSVPAEVPGRESAVVSDELDFFLAPERARGIAIYRVEADDESRAAALHHARQRLGTPFRVVENDREGQYCTTLIWYAWQRAGIDLGAKFEYLDVPLASGHYLLPHSLRTAKRLYLLHEDQGTGGG